ncbi:hypothetical protein JST97_00270 [bacterium]|nr:hypothetical protein [bacterium]
MTEIVTKLLTMISTRLTYNQVMIAEQLSRSQLQRQLQTRMWELRQAGQDSRDLKNFLARLRNLPGQTVGDMCHYWSQSQAERRPVYQLLWLAVALLSSSLLFKLAGIKLAAAALVVSGLCSFVHTQLLWQEENRFADELMLRADAAFASLRLTR